jgi:hypothetical protein
MRILPESGKMAAVTPSGRGRDAGTKTVKGAKACPI